jgi:uncharacterized protein YwqG
MVDNYTGRRGLFRSVIQGMGRVATESNSILDSLRSLTSPNPDESHPPEDAPIRARASMRTMSLEETLAAAGRFGLEERKDSVAQVARAAINLTAEPDSGAVSAFVGGRPELPSGTEWPHSDGRPLSFLAQVNLGELPAAVSPFPSKTKLMFFFDVRKVPSGFLQAHRCAGAVLAMRSGSAPDRVAGGRRAQATVETVLPRVWSKKAEDLDLSDDERFAWERLRAHLAEAQETMLSDAAPTDRIAHRIFGYPDSTQGDMPLICELVANGYDVPAHPFTHPEAEQFEDRAGRWEMLAQFSADREFGWSWGAKQERLYFWIDRDMLDAGDLSGVRAILR